MSDTFTLTTSKPLRIGMNKPDFGKWETITCGYPNEKGIMIRIRNVGVGFHSQIQHTIHPYKNFSKKWKQTLWLKWLKLRVWIGDLYKS